MPRKPHKPEEIVAKLRQVDVLVREAIRLRTPSLRSARRR